MHYPNTFLTLPDAPSISGLAFRLFRGEADISAIRELRQAMPEADRNAHIPGPDRNTAPTCDPLQDCLITECTGRMIGLTWLDWWRDTNNAQIYLHFGWLEPNWRRKGIGRAILHWQEQRLRQLASSNLSTDPSFFGNHTAETQVGTRALLLSEGYHMAFTRVEMTYQIPSTPIQRSSLPDKLTLRPFKKEQLPVLYAANAEAFQDYRLDYKKESYEIFLKDIHWPDRETNLWFIAWDGDQIAGLVINEIHGNRGVTLSMAVRRPWRKRGLARALMSHTLQYFQEHAVQYAEISTVIENSYGPFELYKSMGYSIIHRLPRYRKAMNLIG